MKKLISILLAVLLLVSVLPMAAFAEEEILTDKFEFDEILFGNAVFSYQITSLNGNFMMEGSLAYPDGWIVGRNCFFKIFDPSCKLIIKSIKAVVSFNYEDYVSVDISGSAVKDGPVPTDNGQTVTVSNINDWEFSFTGSNGLVGFKDITIYYTDSSNTGSTLSQGNMTIICSVAALALGFSGGFFLGKKKKPAVAAAKTKEE